jgi:hypothetical protein
MNDSIGRLVRADLSLTLDGRFNGPGGAGDIGAIVSYMTTDVAHGQLTRIHDRATTAVLGRGSAEGFLGWWGQVAEDANADPRDRGYAQWLVGAPINFGPGSALGYLSREARASLRSR